MEWPYIEKVSNAEDTTLKSRKFAQGHQPLRPPPLRPPLLREARRVLDGRGRLTIVRRLPDVTQWVAGGA